MIKAIIFDCFGVLISDALGEMRNKLIENEPEKYQEILDILHARHRGFVAGEESSRRVAELLGLSLEEYQRQHRDNEIKNVELMKYIFTLKKKYKTAILSNISVGGIERRFTSNEIKSHFDVVVASGETGYAKPEAQIYEIAADRLGVRLDECVFTDDNQDFCEAARGVGMQTILYRDLKQFKSELEELLAI